VANIQVKVFLVMVCVVLWCHNPGDLDLKDDFEL